MSMEDFENCMIGEYNADAEAVKFIIQIFELGGEEALQTIKDNWEKIAAASGIIAAIAKWGGESPAVKFIQRIVGAAGAAVAELLLAMLAGLALAAIILAVEAGISCAYKASQ